MNVSRLPAAFTTDVFSIIIRMFDFMDLQPGFRVWVRLNQPDALWQPLSYAPRSTDAEAWELAEHYRDQFGTHYEYGVWPCGQRPVGMCVPY